MLFVLVVGLPNNQPHLYKSFLLSLIGEEGVPVPGLRLPRENCQQVLPGLCSLDFRHHPVSSTLFRSSQSIVYGRLRQ